MINKIKDWLFMNYGIDVRRKHIILVLILIFSVLVFLIALVNSGIEQGGKGVPIVEDI